MKKNRHVSEGVFAKAGRAADETAALADSMRSGTLTGPEFDAWYQKRSAQGAEIAVAMREKAMELKAPLVSALERGAAALRRVEAPVSVKPRRARPAVRRSVRK